MCLTLTRNWGGLEDLNGREFEPVDQIYYCIIKIYNYEWVKERRVQWMGNVYYTWPYYTLSTQFNFWTEIVTSKQDFSSKTKLCLMCKKMCVRDRYYPTWKYLRHMMVQMASLTFTPIWCLECNLPFIATLLSNMMYPPSPFWRTTSNLANSSVSFGWGTES